LAPFERLGFSDVGAYQAAGNVTFRADDDAVDIAEIASVVSDAYGFDAPVFLRTASHVGTLEEAVPFSAAQVAATAGKIQVGFLSEAPSAADLTDADALVPGDDLATVVEREWFWLPKTGISDSSMPMKGIEKAIGPMTIRTLGTLQRMTKKFGA
jgi:uncharacterized protein (DUF1697 family)